METDDDEIDLSLLAMGKRIKKNLDGEDRDDLIDELNQTVSRFIKAVRNCKKKTRLLHLDLHLAHQLLHQLLMSLHKVLL